MYPTKMQKVRIILPKSKAREVIKSLHRLGLMEIRSAPVEGLSRAAPLNELNEISKELLKIRSMLNFLGLKADRSLSFSEGSLEKAKEITFDTTLRELYNRLEEISSRKKQVEDNLNLAKTLLPFSDVDFSKLRFSDFSYVVGYFSKDKFKKFKKELQRFVPEIEFKYVEKKDRVVLLAVYPEDSAFPSVLSKFSFVSYDIPKDMGNPKEYISKLEKEINDLEKEEKEIKRNLQEYSQKYGRILQQLENSLSILADRAEITSRFSESKNIMVIEGWVEKKNLHRLKESLSKFKGVILEEIEKKKGELPPTKLKVPSLAKPIAFITESFTLPKADEIDPTWLYMITLPLLYGMIVGDVIYGIISLVLANFLLKKFKKSYIMSNVSKIWLIGSIPTVFFGIIFNEWCGMTLSQFLNVFGSWGFPLSFSGPIYHGLSRSHSLPELIGITALVGVVHLGLGFLLGAINAWHHNKKHAIAKLAWIGVEIGGLLMLLSSMFNMLPPTYLEFGGAILLISVVLIAWGEGIIGIIEIPGLVGNILSYARIAAIGVVGVILAEIINDAFLPTGDKGLVNLIFIPVFLLLHVLNAFIAMFEALIQGGRLNIIEFKLKFVEGGGLPFKPFALKKEVK